MPAHADHPIAHSPLTSVDLNSTILEAVRLAAESQAQQLLQLQAIQAPQRAAEAAQHAWSSGYQARVAEENRDVEMNV